MNSKPSIRDIEQNAAALREAVEDPKSYDDDVLSALIRNQFEQDQDQKRTLRDKLANRVITIVVGWLIFVGALLFLQSCSRDDWVLRARLDNSVLIAVVSSTTISVLGLLAIVVGDLFPRGPRKGL